MLASSRFVARSASISSCLRRQSLSRFLRRNLSSTNPNLAAIVELCEDELHPSAVDKYLTLNGENTSLIPTKFLRICTLPETGGYLNVSTQIHHYNEGFDERNEVMCARSLSHDWNRHMESTKPCIMRQKSTIFVEAPLVSRMDDIPGLAAGTVEDVLRNSVGKEQEENRDDCIYEFRRYQLKLGYDTVPKFLDMYEGGLPSKLQAEGTDPTTNLITLLYSECGPLNEVIEIWRHGAGTTAMDRSRVAARKATEWRNAIANIAGLAETFTSTIHRPTDYSPLR